jgi:hypothetical protein
MSFSNTLFSILFSSLIFYSNTVFSQPILDLFTNKRNAVVVSPYDFPITNTYLATLSFVTAQPSKNIQYKILPITMHPERASIPYYGKNNVLNLAFLNHEDNPTAPLIFIVPGLGCTTVKSSTLYLAEMFYNDGYNVVTLPSTMSWQFALSVSRTGFPGYSQIDAEDMLNLMKTADYQLRQKTNINPSKYAIVGFSLGALDSSFIANLDLEKHYFNFEQVLMINPPIQKDKSISILDRLMNIGDVNFINTSFANIEKLLNFNFNLRIGLSNPQMAWIIGSNFRKSLHHVLLLSQEIDNQNIFKTPSTPFWKEIREAEAYSYNFRDYINKFLFTKLKNSEIPSDKFNTPEELIALSDMRIQLQSLSDNNVKWAIFHNKNDFIFHDNDLEYLMNSNSDSRIYPVGGHLGNIWFNQNRHDILNFMALLKK